jgi:hypothetical protein
LQLSPLYEVVDRGAFVAAPDEDPGRGLQDSTLRASSRKTITTDGQVVDAKVMGNMDEVQAVEQVYQRLVVRFPTVPVATVRATVQELHASLEGPVRDYVPLLVERGARDRLSAMVASGTPPVA